MNFELIKDEIRTLLQGVVNETGRNLAGSAEDVAQYAAERAQHLARIYDQPGFDLALKAERDNVAMFAGIALVDQADAIDARILGIIEGALSIAKRVLA